MITNQIPANAVSDPLPARLDFKRILVPVDFSTASRSGLALAAAVAQHFRARLQLLHVVEPPSLPEWGYVHLTIRDAKLRHAAEERLPQFPFECGVDSDLVNRFEVLCGESDLQICRAAADSNVDLIVLSTHGLGAISRAFLGSTAERVVRRASCPVLAVRDPVLRKGAPLQEPFELRRILVTTDFSDASTKAFPYAVAMARKFNASLTLLYVVPYHMAAYFGHRGLVLDEAQLADEARERLPRFRQAELDPHIYIDTHVSTGNPAQRICETAENFSSDLIVISTHGHKGFRHLVLGSVTENVVRHAPCPVLVVRAPHDELIKARAKDSRHSDMSSKNDTTFVT